MRQRITCSDEFDVFAVGLMADQFAKCPTCGFVVAAVVPPVHCVCGSVYDPATNSVEATAGQRRVHHPTSTNVRGRPGKALRILIQESGGKRNCDCTSYTSSMDKWGVDKCKENISSICKVMSRIVFDSREVDPRMKDMVERAIRQAEGKEDA